MLMKLNIVTVMIPVLESGSTTLINDWNGVHPSMVAASSSSTGYDPKKPCNMNIENESEVAI